MNWNKAETKQLGIIAGIVGSRQYEARFKSRSRSKTGSPRRKKVSHSRSRLPGAWEKKLRGKGIKYQMIPKTLKVEVGSSSFSILISFYRPTEFFFIWGSSKFEWTESTNPCLGAWPMFILVGVGPRCQKRCQIFQLVLSLSYLLRIKIQPQWKVGLVNIKFSVIVI